jgi:hypothetical protein
MPSWDEVKAAAPELVANVQHAFTRRKHHTMATVRADGSPRISGTEVEIADGKVVLGSMTGARKAQDLKRDPRVALHSQGEDPPEADPSDWAGEAKISGTAAQTPHDEHDRFEIDVTEVVYTRVEGDELVVRWWTPSGGEQVVRRK